MILCHFKFMIPSLSNHAMLLANVPKRQTPSMFVLRTFQILNSHLRMDMFTISFWKINKYTKFFEKLLMFWTVANFFSRSHPPIFARVHPLLSVDIECSKVRPLCIGSYRCFQLNTFVLFTKLLLGLLISTS